MHSLISSLNQGRFVLVVSLSSNRTELAAAAEENHADALEVHINTSSQGMGSGTGSFEIEEQALKDIVSTLKIPIGIEIGDARPLTPEDWERVLSIQFDFVSMLAHHMPLYVLKDDRLSKIAGIGAGYVLEQVRAISENEGVDIIKAAIVPQQAYGQPFNALDLATLKILAKLSSKPLVVPTQKSIRPQDLEVLRASGCQGVFLDSVVAGSTPDSYRYATSDFKRAIETMESS